MMFLVSNFYEYWQFGTANSLELICTIMFKFWSRTASQYVARSFLFVLSDMFVGSIINSHFISYSFLVFPTQFHSVIS